MKNSEKPRKNFDELKDLFSFDHSDELFDLLLSDYVNQDLYNILDYETLNGLIYYIDNIPFGNIEYSQKLKWAYISINEIQFLGEPHG